MHCRLCSSPGKFAKSHIIPEAFWRELRDGKDMPLLISSAEGTFPQRAPIGVYDPSILCDQCEVRFNEMDAYGIDILLKRRDELFKPIEHHGVPIAWQAEAVDSHKLLVFLVGTLWRASVSSHPFYWRVDLGPLEPLARQVVLNQSEEIPAVFGAALSRWRSRNEHESLAKGLMDPFKENWSGTTAYRFYFGEVVAYIKADQRNFPIALKKQAIGESEHVTMVARSFEQSKDLGALRETAIKSHRNHLAFKSRHSR